MSRIGRLPVEIPGGVDVTINGREVSVSGPKGSLALELAPPIEISREDSTLKVTRPNDEGKVRALHGLSRTLVANMVTGVTEGYSKTLEIIGVGYRATAAGPGAIDLALGFSHPVKFTAPDGVTFEVPTPTRVIIKGPDKEIVTDTYHPYSDRLGVCAVPAE